ncbi:MAG: PPK2 family polyphosphate kinase [Phycisphaerae bacterium]
MKPPKSALQVKPGRTVKLNKFDPASTHGVPEREEAGMCLAEYLKGIGTWQDRLYAQGTQALLIVLQGMDAAGKDGTVRTVLQEVNPAGVRVTSFKVPSSIEIKQDFLARIHVAVPPRGYIGVFNRSHYEDVLVARVHADKAVVPELRERKDLWEERFESINNFELHLSRNRVRILKFFLHISPEEQAERLRARQHDPEKHWKLSRGDFEQRPFWGQYQAAFEKMLTATSTAHAPWYIIPSDRKWVRNYHVAKLVLAQLEMMAPEPPVVADPELLTIKFE